MKQLSICLISSSLLASGVAELESQMSEILTQAQLGDFGAKTASAQPQIHSSRFFAKLDLLLWEAYFGGSDYALTNTPTDSERAIGDVKRGDFRWRWGWRGEVGYRLPHDGWDLLGDFTWYQSKSDNSTSGFPTGTLIPLLSRFEALDTGASASILWKLLFEVCDVNLRRSYFLSRQFSVAPFFGMRNAWVHQGFHARYVSSSAVTVQGEQHFWGIGPVAGFGTEWHINKSWWFFSNFAGSLLAGNYDLSSKQVYTSTQALSSNTQKMAPNVQGALGFGWQMNINNNTNHLAARLCYEAQYWWKQNLITLYGTDTANLFSRGFEDLGLQGFTLDVLYDF